jgi:hypothetical protein
MKVTAQELYNLERDFVVIELSASQSINRSMSCKKIYQLTNP